MPRRFWVETLGCPKNQVDSDKLTGTLVADGLVPADAPEDADLVVVNTCAFIEEARQESIDTILGWPTPQGRRAARRHRLPGRALRRRAGDALPEVDAVAGFADAVPVTLGHKPALPDDRPAEPASAEGRCAVGLREGGRGLRPSLRVLRHPELPRQAALADDRRHPRRGRRARCPRDRARRPGPRQLRTRPGPRRARHRSARRSRRRHGSTGCGCSTCTRPI